MQKVFTFVAGLFLVIHGYCQAPPSPEAFLGYKLGDHFTLHYKVVNYFKAVAQAVPSQVKLEQYGETYEGRPLMVAFIATPENLSKLEEIRLNNLRLAGVSKDKAAANEDAPAIVWLSYNVHGNEASSTEASMKMLYELVNPSNPKVKEWLQHTIVVIDPCINPDGRDRYVNWFNMAVGRYANPDPQSREHREPWPGGRSNHYNFDLNRDWAWQTQVETKSRLKLYNMWLPQVHVDFHEQGYNNPYYFAPAAEPYHDVITPWQRDFQVQIGRNNAKYFDQNGWLYFTKERFDLFYPSYGDTYPIYNGGIGMTFEQGGHSRGGLAVIKNDEDTLTLGDRLLHHFTTGMSTVEVSAGNYSKLIKEYHKYFVDAVSRPAGEFKSYIVRDDKYGDRLEKLKLLLDRNKIDYVPVAAGTYNGVDYETGKAAAFKTAAGDIAINANQPKSNLLRVLFERSSRISDSVTYDITAWSLPFVYGLQAYGLNVFVSAGSGASSEPAAGAVSGPAAGAAGSGASGAAVTGSGEAAPYAYAVRWMGMKSVKFLTELLKKGVKVRYSETAFQSGGQEFAPGTLIITSTGNVALGSKLWPVVATAAGNTGVQLVTVASGFVDKGYDFGSDRVHVIKKPRVAFLTGDQVSSLNAGEVWHFFEQELEYPVTQLNADEVARLDLKQYDVLIVPNGYYRILSDKGVAETLKSWVRGGGRLIAMEGAVAQLAKAEWGLHLRNEDTGGVKKDGDKDKKEVDYSALHKYGNRERDEVTSSVPGSIYKVDLDNTHPLAFGYTDHYYTLRQDDNIYDFIKEDGWNVGVIKKDNYVAGFTGNKAKERMKDAVIFGVQEMGRGQVVYLADDPLFRLFWENGKLLFSNAVFLVGQY